MIIVTVTAKTVPQLPANLQFAAALINAAWNQANTTKGEI